jgi:guanylate kinase
MEIKVEIPFIALIGVSGAGKSHFIDLLVKRFGFSQIPSVTTRKKRKEEIEGYDKFLVVVKIV